jgi:hypothetical protein
MWNLHLLAQTYQQRPSAFLDIADPWAAYQFDRAVIAFGQHVDEQLSKKRRLSQILADDDGPPEINRAQLGSIRRVQLSEEGVW